MNNDKQQRLASILWQWLRQSTPGTVAGMPFARKYDLRDFQAWVEHCTGEVYTLKEVQEAVRFLVEFPIIQISGNCPTKPDQTQLVLQ